MTNKILIKEVSKIHNICLGLLKMEGYQEYQELSEIFRKRYLTQSKSR